MLSVFILSFFLLSPFTKLQSRETEKPLLIFAHDNSESVVLNKDSVFLQSEFIRNLNSTIADLGEIFDTVSVSFSDRLASGISGNYSGKQSDYSGLLDELENNFSNRNIGAVIVSGDGVFNKGVNPVYSSSLLKTKIFTLALGDTSLKKDISVKRVLHNKYAFLGNAFPIEVFIEANKLKGEKTKLTVAKNGKQFYKQEINITSDFFSKNYSFQLEAEQPGIQHYNIVVESISGEVTVRNNRYDIFIEVLDSRQKVLILADAPHPDIACIKEGIEKNKSYEVETCVESNFKENINKYNLIILHQLPASSSQMTLLESIKSSAIPYWIITGKKTSIPLLNQMNAGVKYSATQFVKNNEVFPGLNKEFTLFTLNENFEKLMRKAPPLSAPFGEPQVAQGAAILMKQKIGSVETPQPLFLFNDALGKKSALLLGEGMWRWKLLEQAEFNSTELTEEIILKTVQYLSVKENKARFRVNCKKSFNENENILVEAEFYNESFESVNIPEAGIVIRNSEGKSYPFAFSKVNNTYRLNAGLLPVGNYTFEASLSYGGSNHQAKGMFSVVALNIEGANLTADHNLLNQLSVKTGGKMFYPHQLDLLKKELMNNDDIKPIIYTQYKVDELIKNKWIFWLLLLLLSAEWFIRKWKGSY